MIKYEPFPGLLVMLNPNCDYIWKVTVALFKYMILLLSRLADYLKECRKCTLLRFSFSGLCDAMWENSLKMSRYVASPDEENKRGIMMKMMQL